MLCLALSFTIIRAQLIEQQQQRARPCPHCLALHSLTRRVRGWEQGGSNLGPAPSFSAVYPSLVDGRAPLPGSWPHASLSCFARPLS